MPSSRSVKAHLVIFLPFRRPGNAGVRPVIDSPQYGNGHTRSFCFAVRHRLASPSGSTIRNTMIRVPTIMNVKCSTVAEAMGTPAAGPPQGGASPLGGQRSAEGTSVGAVRYHPVGCDACGLTGYKGRTGVYELMVADEQVRGRIHQKAREGQVRAATHAGRGPGALGGCHPRGGGGASGPRAIAAIAAPGARGAISPVSAEARRRTAPPARERRLPSPSRPCRPSRPASCA